MNMYCLLCARHWEPWDEPKGEYSQTSTIHGIYSSTKFILVSYYLDKFDQ